MVTTDLGNEFVVLDRELPAEAVHRTKRRHGRGGPGHPDPQEGPGNQRGGSGATTSAPTRPAARDRLRGPRQRGEAAGHRVPAAPRQRRQALWAPAASAGHGSSSAAFVASAATCMASRPPAPQWLCRPAPPQQPLRPLRLRLLLGSRQGVRLVDSIPPVRVFVCFCSLSEHQRLCVFCLFVFLCSLKNYTSLDPKQQKGITSLYNQKKGLSPSCKART